MVIFASEFQALLAHPGLKREIDPCSVEDYFAYSFIPHPRTIYKGVAKLPPAHSLTLRRDRPLTETSRYWDVAFGEVRRVNESEWLIAAGRDNSSPQDGLSHTSEELAARNARVFVSPTTN